MRLWPAVILGGLFDIRDQWIKVVHIEERDVMPEHKVVDWPGKVVRCAERSPTNMSFFLTTRLSPATALSQRDYAEAPPQPQARK